MTELAFQLTQTHLPSSGFDRPDQAPAMLEQQRARRIFILPFVLVAAVLFATNVWIASRLQGDRERAFLFAAIGAAGVPIFQWSPSVCRIATGQTSAARLDRTEILSLLTGN